MDCLLFNTYYLPGRVCKLYQQDIHQLISVGTMIDHLQERLGDLNGDDSVIARFRALDHNLWREIGETRESKEVFVLHGRDDVTFLHTHYATLMDRHLATKADTLHEYRLYKSWARGRVTSARETYTAMLHTGTLQAHNAFNVQHF